MSYKEIYSAKLRDPRWQKKRLEVFERAGWACQNCYDKEETLQVHHLVYSKGEPWDAPDNTLECLCETCHDWRERFNERWGRSAVKTIICRFFEEHFLRVFTTKNQNAIGYKSVGELLDDGRRLHNVYLHEFWTERGELEKSPLYRKPPPPIESDLGKWI